MNHSNDAPPLSAANEVDTLHLLLSQDMEAVNQLIISKASSQHAPLIATLATHLVGAGGKRLRPMVALAAARLCGEPGDRHIKLAAAVEFIHTATLLHDDVIDNSSLRRKKATANILWGNKASILVGDFLFSRSFELMVGTDDLRVLDVLARTSSIISEGEVMQLARANDLNLSEVEYYQIITAKTAALFSAAGRAGAMISGASEEQENALATYGAELGVLFQLTDDILDYDSTTLSLGKNIGDDFREGKVTLPVLLAFAQGDSQEKEFWNRVMQVHDQTDQDLDHAIKLLHRHRTLDQTRERASLCAQRARTALEPFNHLPVAEALANVADFCMNRLS